MEHNQLIHDFLQFLIENYGIRLSMNEEDAKLFKQRYPDLAIQLEKLVMEDDFIKKYCLSCINHSNKGEKVGKECSHYEVCVKQRESK